MIVRMWHGRVETSKAQAYREFLNMRAIPDYRSVPGNISVHILERKDGEVTHFITLTFWQNKTYEYKAAEEKNIIAALTRMGDDESMTKSITLKKPMDVRILAIGEGYSPI